MTSKRLRTIATHAVNPFQLVTENGSQHIKRIILGLTINDKYFIVINKSFIVAIYKICYFLP